MKLARIASTIAVAMTLASPLTVSADERPTSAKAERSSGAEIVEFHNAERTRLDAAGFPQFSGGSE